jgi:hypothetical protein
MIWVNQHKSFTRFGRPQIDRIARPDKNQAGRRIEWQVAAEALTFQGKVPSH